MKRRNFIQAASGTPLLASIGTVSAKNEGFSIPQINPPDDLQRFESHIIEFDMSEVKGVEFSEPDVTFVPPSITESGAYFSNSKGWVSPNEGSMIAFDRSGGVSQDDQEINHHPGLTNGKLAEGAEKLNDPSNLNIAFRVSAEGNEISIQSGIHSLTDIANNVEFSPTDPVKISPTVGAAERVNFPESNDKSVFPRMFDRMSVINHGICQFFTHPTENLLPLDGPGRDMIMKAKKLARSQNKSLEALLSNEYYEREIFRIPPINAVLLKSRRIYSQAGQNERGTKKSSNENGKRLRENGGEE